MDCLSTFRPADIDELKEIIYENTVKTTHVLDPLPKKQMSKCIDVLLPHLLDLVNSSLSTGNIDGIKYAHVKPLLKKIVLDTFFFEWLKKSLKKIFLLIKSLTLHVCSQYFIGGLLLV